MINQSIGLAHAEARRRNPKKGTNKKEFGVLDKLVYVIGFMGIIMSIPQITTIWVGKTSAGISVITWIFYLIGSIFWMIYGIAHKSKPIMITYVLWIIVNSLIILGALIY